jgi:hypothetical protein
VSDEKESPRAGTREPQKQSPILEQHSVTPEVQHAIVDRIRAACPNMEPMVHMQPAQQVEVKLSPQERKQEKVRERVQNMTGLEFPYILAGMVHDAVRTGLRVTNKEEEEAKGYRLHCSTEYHFMRMTGPGSTLVPLLYGVSMHLASDSQDFHITLSNVARYLGLDDKADALYAAADLLVSSGFWEVIETSLGAATKYRPLGHKVWAAKCGLDEWNGAQVGKYCTVKAEFPHKEGTPEMLLGAKLHGITGENYFTGVLKGWLKIGSAAELQVWARDFMHDDGGNEAGTARRVRLGNHFRACAARRAAL